MQMWTEYPTLVGFATLYFHFMSALSRRIPRFYLEGNIFSATACGNLQFSTSGNASVNELKCYCFRLLVCIHCAGVHLIGFIRLTTNCLRVLGNVRKIMTKSREVGTGREE